MTSALILVFRGAFGLALGSYAVTAGIRLSRSEPSSSGRSHCDACGVVLGFAHTLPVISYIRAAGACRACGARIDPLHLGGELAGAAVLIGAPWSQAPARAALVSIIGLTLITAAAVDFKVLRLPDALTSMVAVSAIALSALNGSQSLVSGAIACTVTVLLLLILRAAMTRRRGEPGLGLGDVKLAAALALWLGPATPVMVVVASGLGLVGSPFLRDARGRSAFGPMIGAAGWLVGVGLERGWLRWLL